MAKRPARMAPRRRRAPEPGTNQPYAADLVSDDAIDLAGEDERDGAPTRAPGPGDAERQDEERKAQNVRRFLRYFKISAEAYDKQRKQELEDRKFARALTEDVWPADILKARQGAADGDTNGGKPTPARPCLTLDKLAAPRRQVMNEARESKLSIRVVPKAGSASKEDAQLVQSAVRAIEVQSKAHQARLWALDSASQCGRGYYRVLTAYANDRDTDLDIVVKRIKNQHSVYPDPWHQEMDGSDMKFCILTEDIPRRSFPDRYPDSKLAKRIAAEMEAERDGREPSDFEDVPASTEGLSASGDEVQGWITESTIRVGEIYEVTHDRREKVWIPVPGDDGGPTQMLERWVDEVPEDMLAEAQRLFPGEVRRRTIMTPKVRWYAFTATEQLDEEAWPGRYIPVIQVLGEEFNVGGESTYKGIITGAKDAQRSYNYHRSKQVEVVGLAPVAPFVAAEGQTEDYPEWETANVANHAVLIYKPTTHGEHLVPPPQRNMAEPAIQGVTIAAQSADEDLKDITGVNDPALGKYRANQSGKAIQTLQQQAQKGSSHYIINLAEISIPHEARVIVDLLEPVYDRPGRVMRLLGERGREEFAPIGVPFVNGPSGPMQVPDANTPVPVPSADPSQPPVMKKPKLYKFSRDAEFTFTVGVGPSQDTQKERNQQIVSELMNAVPALAPLVADIFAKQLDGDIADELSQRLKLAQPALAGLPEDEDSADLPPEAQAMVQGLKMQLQQVTQQAQQLQQQIEMDTVKSQATMAVADRTARSREQVAAIAANVALMTAKIAAAQKRDGGELDAETEKALQEAQHVHERLMLMLEMQFEAAGAEEEAALGREERRDTLAHDMARENLRARADERKLSRQERMHTQKLQQQALASRQKVEADDRKLRAQAQLKTSHERVKGAEARKTATRQAALAVATRPPDAKPKRASKN